MCYAERTFRNYKGSKRPNMSNCDLGVQCNRCIWTKYQGLDFVVKEIPSQNEYHDKINLYLRTMQTFELLL